MQTLVSANVIPQKHISKLEYPNLCRRRNNCPCPPEEIKNLLSCRLKVMLMAWGYVILDPTV